MAIDVPLEEDYEQEATEAWDEIDGQELDPETVKKARALEMEWYRKMNVYEKRQQKSTGNSAAGDSDPRKSERRGHSLLRRFVPVRSSCRIRTHMSDARKRTSTSLLGWRPFSRTWNLQAPSAATSSQAHV